MSVLGSRRNGKPRVTEDPEFYVGYLIFWEDTQGGSVVGKGSSYQCGLGRNVSSITVSERSPERGNGNPLQYSPLEDHMDRGTWQAAIHGLTKGQKDPATEHACTHIHNLTI